MAEARNSIAAPVGMAGSNPRADMLTHVVLVLGVLLFALPIWIVLMGSTHDAGTIGRGDVPLLPGAGPGPAHASPGRASPRDPDGRGSRLDAAAGRRPSADGGPRHVT